MTRRKFMAASFIAGVLPAPPAASVSVPIHLVIDSRPKWPPEQIGRFWSGLWPQTVQNFASGGIRLDVATAAGEVKRSPGGRPIFVGLDRAALNFVVTDQIPMLWDRARALSGVTTRCEGYHVCVAALNYAHRHQIPYLSVNTCVHEMLHALLGDIFEDRPAGVTGAARELRVDWYGTRLWLFHEGTHIRKSAHTYVERLRWEVASRS
jgi:hypothetical protein